MAGRDALTRLLEVGWQADNANALQLILALGYVRPPAEQCRVLRVSNVLAGLEVVVAGFAGLLPMRVAQCLGSGR